MKKTTSELTRRSRRVVFQPNCGEALRRGSSILSAAVKPTLGPFPRLTAVQDVMVRNNAPELLDDGGTIARRIIEIGDRDADVGAMLLRDALWKLREDVGDGTACVAALFEAVFSAGLRYAAAGGDVMELRVGLDRGMRRILSMLQSMAKPLGGEDDVVSMARMICHDEPMAQMLGEIFDVIGSHGHLDIVKGKRKSLEREYVEGSYWDSGWLSSRMITDPDRRVANVYNAALLLTNIKLSDQDVPKLAELVDMVMKHGRDSLVIVAPSVSDRVVGLLLLNGNEKENGKFATLAAKVAEIQPRQTLDLEDMAILTGGRVINREAGESLDGIKWEDLGQARRVWASQFHLGVVAGEGDKHELRGHIIALRKSIPKIDDKYLRELTLLRVGRLMGGAAIMRVGGSTDSELTVRKDLAERTARVLRAGIEQGVVPGGGIALLDCQPSLRDESSSEGQGVAFRILAEAMEAPFRVILSNAGFDPSTCLMQVRMSGPKCAFDVCTGKVVDVEDSGILDVVSVLKAACRTAITTAALALTTDVLVHRRRRDPIHLARPDTSPPNQSRRAT